MVRLKRWDRISFERSLISVRAMYFISDLAAGVDADYIKAGAPARGERVAKYNRLLKIGEEL